MICCLNPDCPNPQNPDGTNFCWSCGAGLMPLLRGRYRIIEPLGGGGFGRTYLAEDVDKLDERCVVKQLAPQLQGSWSLKKATELFQQEAKRLQQLGEHPQIPTLYAYFQEENYLYLVQQFIEGQNLLQELQHQGVFNEAKIRELLSDLSSVLQAIHQQLVIHRDIKPENIIRRQSDGKLVLIDFGVAKQATATVALPGTTIGSFGYAPMEQLQGGEAYPASDLYSLGATCFHLVTQIPPREMWLRQGYSWISGWRKYLRQPISQELGHIFDRLLQENHKKRYQSASALLQDLNSQLTPRFKIPITLVTPPQETQLLQEFPSWELLPRAVLTGSGSSLLAIALLSFLGTVWISSGLWLLIVAGLIFAPSRPIVEKTYLFTIAVITTLVIFLISQNLPIGNPLKAGFNGLLVVVLLVILAGLLAFTIMGLSHIFNKLISNFF